MCRINNMWWRYRTIRARVNSLRAKLKCTHCFTWHRGRLRRHYQPRRLSSQVEVELVDRRGKRPLLPKSSSQTLISKHRMKQPEIRVWKSICTQPGSFNNQEAIAVIQTQLRSSRYHLSLTGTSCSHLPLTRMTIIFWSSNRHSLQRAHHQLTNSIILRHLWKARLVS